MNLPFFLNTARLIVKGILTGPKVRAGAKRPPCPCHDDGPDIIVLISLVKRIYKLVTHCCRKGIQIFRTVEGDCQNLVFNIIQDMFIGHGITSGFLIIIWLALSCHDKMI